MKRSGIGSADDAHDGVATPTAGVVLPRNEGDAPQRRRRPRGGMVLSSFRRWTARDGLALFATLAIVVLLLLLAFAAISLDDVGSGVASSGIEVPSCPASPWKADEDLRGKCPESFKAIPGASSVPDCAVSCCDDSECITWQFRRDVGCLHGKDVRLGMEKDGVPAWCSDHAPRRWRGQHLVPRGKKKEKDDGGKDARRRACDEATWSPEEEVGQCFGLGDVRPRGGGSAGECMRACCDDEKCGAWQWNEEVSGSRRSPRSLVEYGVVLYCNRYLVLYFLAGQLGCFYGKGMHSCQGHGDPISFEPFVGRRKRLASRSYVGPGGKPWQMKMD
jgi:hypothetical protein